MTMTINGSGTITGLAVGGLPDGTINAADLASNAVTTVKITDANVTQAKLETLCVPVGVGQTWQNVAASRAIGTTYTNSTGRPIFVSVTLTGSTLATDRISASIDGTVFASRSTSESQYTTWGLMANGVDFVVPAGSTYSVNNLTNTNVITYWFELR